MKSRWLVNLLLLLLVAGIVSFIYLRPPEQDETRPVHEISTLKLAEFKRLSIEFPAKAAVVFEKRDDFWYLVQPYAARADQMTVQRIVSLVAAKTLDKFPADDARFGIDNPRLKIRLDDEVFTFGIYNPVTSEQYVAYKDSVYLLPGIYSEIAATQIVELLDKNPLKPSEQSQIAGFDFSRLEQWEDIRLQVSLNEQQQWQVSVPNAKPKAADFNEWFETNWTKMRAASVEPYTPDRKANFPSFTVKFKDGKQVVFDKLQESPDMVIGRADEGMKYHFPSDVGFSMLNPPIGLGK